MEGGSIKDGQRQRQADSRIPLAPHARSLLLLRSHSTPLLTRAPAIAAPLHFLAASPPLYHNNCSAQHTTQLSLTRA